LNIVDEVSFACFDKDQTKLSQNLQSFTECTSEAYGNIAIVFIGDFCQLAPVMGVEIYAKERAYVWEQCLNSLVELKGTHRYRDCPILAKAMPELRDGEAEEMRRLLETRLVTPGGLHIPTEGKVQYATWTNKKKASINARIFKKHLMAHHSECADDPIPTNAIVIMSSAKWSTTRTKLSHAQQHKRFLETCSEQRRPNLQRKPKTCGTLALFDPRRRRYGNRESRSVNRGWQRYMLHFYKGNHKMRRNNNANTSTRSLGTFG
jgi:hypothetical protein